MASSTDQGPTGRHPLAESSDGPLGLKESLASDFPGLRPGLSSQAPWGPRSENLRRMATTLLRQSARSSVCVTNVGALVQSIQTLGVEPRKSRNTPKRKTEARHPTASRNVFDTPLSETFTTTTPCIFCVFRVFRGCIPARGVRNRYRRTGRTHVAAVRRCHGPLPRMDEGQGTGWVYFSFVPRSGFAGSTAPD